MVNHHDEPFHDDEDDENQPLINNPQRSHLEPYTDGDAATDAPAAGPSQSDSSAVAGRGRRHDTTRESTTQAGTMDSGKSSGTKTVVTATGSADDPDHPDAPIGSNSSNLIIPDNNHNTATSSGNGIGNGNGSDNDTTLQIEDDSGPSTPRFIQDEQAWKRWKWVPYPVRRTIKAVIKWSHGPPNPQPYRIKPFFPVIQEYPLWLVERFIPNLKHRFWLLFAYFSVWLITFVLLMRQSTVASDLAGWGTPQSIGCGYSYWGSGNACGLDGSDCRPFNGSGFAFRCTAGCSSYHVLNPYAVGDQEVIYRSLVVGGPSSDVAPETATYRGDSFICGAAIHAGIITNSHGGCGVVKLVGQQDKFISSQRNGIISVGFDTYFPIAYQFENDITCNSPDVRWSLLALTAVFTGVLSLLTASPALFFFPIFVSIYWTTGMALDRPSNGTIAGLFSNQVGKFLPAMFCAWVMYDKMGIRRTLKGLTAQIEKSILWLGACWVGAMDNYTLSFIPIQRLSKHDLEQQPGARAALATIIIMLSAIIACQVFFFRHEGRLLPYLKLYILFIASILIALAIPGLNLRLHHYILALLLLPGTSMQMRPSLLYQGLLVGLFINGVARWGFDPVLQTSAALQGDAQKGTRLPVVPLPVIDLANNSHVSSNITFSWDVPNGRRYDGISILVNDVERFRAYFEDVDYKDRFTWNRNNTLGLPEYFRFAFMDGSSSGDYTKAGIWTSEGEWVKMSPGPSRRSVRGLDNTKPLRQ